jgi:hypothetical protein
MKHTRPVGAAARGNRRNVAEERSMRGEDCSSRLSVRICSMPGGLRNLNLENPFLSTDLIDRI